MPVVWINRLGEKAEPVPTRDLHDLKRLPETLDVFGVTVTAPNFGQRCLHNARLCKLLNKSHSRNKISLCWDITPTQRSARMSCRIEGTRHRLSKPTQSSSGEKNGCAASRIAASAGVCYNALSTLLAQWKPLR